MQKKEFLTHWKAIKPNRPLKPRPVPYKHEGSTYEMDGVRITGDPKFVDAVLSRLKDLLRFENCETRLQVVYQETKDKGNGRPSVLGSVNCYVQVHRRGREAAMVNTFASALAGREVVLSRGY